MGTEYSRLMEGMVDKLETRVKELEDERDRLYGEQMGAADWVQMSRDHLARADKAEAERDAALAEVERLRAMLVALNEELRKAVDAGHWVDSQIGLSEKQEGWFLRDEYWASRLHDIAGSVLPDEPPPELWPCGHKKTHSGEVCRECSP